MPLGPYGLGPRTGRAAGLCAGFSVPGFMNPVGKRFWRKNIGSWFRHGSFGFGRGWRHWYYATGLPFWARKPYPFDHNPVNGPKYEEEILSQEAKYLKEQLKVIEERLEELKKAKKEGNNEEKDQE
ncbi:DUF5320 domain-containing protein [Carboxydothermus ferrireducens]|uniref:DUF5320 domain-containing protein n=1 Tax=Carboxydothermus ferrireducens DSM 11255 TaxID=1119529 RepID=A0ABX2R6A5_9THEO|nr:DUF5320 domain-containing protein [Carboxydothermus ferrireducens]NYE56699.1 hypothetical protein [Carboxydothermus ferrireducens DSM 11255]